MKVINIQDIDIPEDCATYDELAQFADKVAELAVNYLEVAEPKRGRWIVGHKTSVFDLAGVETWAVRMTCSECSFSLNFVEGHTAQYRFCPQCGARMENEE